MHPSIIPLRHELHQHPDLSGAEQQTASRVKAYLRQHHPGELIDGLGGAGFAMVYNFGKGGKNVVIRCELDALPIPETNTFARRSVNPEVSHKCGHDGHMAMVAGLVFWLQRQTFSQGRVVLLFQPAEENGTGAALVCQAPGFQALHPDYIFALHNIPGEPMGTIIGLPDHFSAEVISCAITLTGKEAHAAEPENGVNPAFACAELLTKIEALNRLDPERSDFAILTPVHCKFGQKAYGIAPGKGELHYTIRTWSAETMESLRQHLISSVHDICYRHHLEYNLEWLEHFPASKNDARANAMVKSAARRAGLQWQQRPYPFKFGEDFGWFTRNYKTAMFGLGAGINTPALHHADYDFPDELLPVGIVMFQALIQEVLNEVV